MNESEAEDPGGNNDHDCDDLAESESDARESHTSAVFVAPLALHHPDGSEHDRGQS